MHPIRLIALALASANAVSALALAQPADADADLDLDLDAPELSATYGGLAKRECYGWSVGWGDSDDKKFARNKARSACRELAGNWAPGQSKSKCYNYSGGGYKINFNVRRVDNRPGKLSNNRPGKLSSKDCEWSLIREINNCAYGGQSKKDGFNFMSDPNLGRC
ncbi:secreted protein [Colletotrichum plurivorum]|uniref:Secreted protein n=1 Tax=Colletotrichum plurivorum TaxID=2175906 RepID=A0A8H6N2Q5_9PEZI|nr:secreted protein [Colletotrichum plurivorum]